jgi:hypothetical protein
MNFCVGRFFNITYVEGDYLNIYSNNDIITFMKVEGILNHAISHNLNHV